MDQDMKKMYQDAGQIIKTAIQEVLPDKAVSAALGNYRNLQNIYVVAVGKAAWKMASSCQRILGKQIRKGIILTKYNHDEGKLEHFEVIEAGHPIPDQNSILGTQKILDMVKDLTEEDNILFLLSGGGSSLFEKPAEGVTLADIQEVTQQCLRCGAGIMEINAIRKRLSDVKGGKFAACCAPAKLHTIVLSDILGDRMDMIASGPMCADTSTCADVLAIVEKYGLKLKENVMAALKKETPRHVAQAEIQIMGSVSEFCRAAADCAKKLGYHSYILTNGMDCEAREAGKFMASVARTAKSGEEHSMLLPCAVIAGGETVVKVLGDGTGGRNQEIALSAANGIRGLDHTVVFSVSSDGTDGPTDAAGGIVDGSTAGQLEALGINCDQVLQNNDSYHALEKVGGLIRIGATGTNVNDITVVLCQ